MEGVLGILWETDDRRCRRSVFRICVFVCRVLGHAVFHTARLGRLLVWQAKGHAKRFNLALAAALVLVNGKVSAV